MSMCSGLLGLGPGRSLIFIYAFTAIQISLLSVVVRTEH
jgi:hypothetical protein